MSKRARLYKFTVDDSNVYVAADSLDAAVILLKEGVDCGEDGIDVEWLAEETTGDRWFQTVPPLLISSSVRAKKCTCSGNVTRKK